MSNICTLDRRDMAQIVEGQGKTIEKIAEDTESSRERAEQGLAEVKQAAVYQPGCIVS
jgi:t-SNARE complex subunit (syntaxin)